MPYYTNFLFLYLCLLLVQSDDSDDRYENRNDLNTLRKFRTEPTQWYSINHIDLPDWNRFTMIPKAVTTPTRPPLYRGKVPKIDSTTHSS